jgi:energy-coupling factor transport system permease protein
MIQDRPKPTFLRRLYPNTKLWLSLGLSVSVVFFANFYYSMTILLIGVFWLIKEKFFLELKVMLSAVLLLGLSMFIINGTLNPVNDYTRDPVFILPLLNWRFYEEGLRYGLYYFQRVSPLMMTLVLLFRTINMTDLGVSMNEAGLAYRSAFIFVSTFQILPLLAKDMQQIMDAQKARGLDMEGNLSKRIKGFLPIMVPVVSNAIMKVQNQAIAMETKGFNSEASKTIYRDLERRPVDVYLKWFSITLALASVVYAVVVSFFL